MSDKIILEHVRASLQPRGTANTVRLAFSGTPSGGAFYNGDFVKRAIDEMEKRITAVQTLGDQFTPLERLAVDLLMSSAGLDNAKDVKALINDTKTN